MKTLLFGLAVLPFLAGVASAADQLSDRQMDWISAGAGDPGCVSSPTSPICTVTTFACPGCAGGQVFAPTSPQKFFQDINAFLKQVGFKIQ